MNWLCVNHKVPQILIFVDLRQAASKSGPENDPQQRLKFKIQLGKIGEKN
jgi:hypothetical protein